MKRTERHMVRGPMHKHFDLEGKTTQQVEARLSQCLQRLEGIHLYHMKLLTREQRQLQKELQRLQQALATNMPKEIYKTKSQRALLHHIGLKDPMRRNKQSLSQHYRSTHFTEEKPQAQGKDSINLPKGIDSSKRISILGQDQEISTITLDQWPGSSLADEIRSTDANLQSDQDTWKDIPPNSMECTSTGNMKGEAMKSTYLELFAKARKAHYLRHRVHPESERLLSTGETFGHEKSLLCKEEKVSEQADHLSLPL
ncbi:coiled-coil domain-containing protein 190 [Trichechus manatus latirostris]|uniref:Coiled-coil domain-containing protein 190 n=1 Tax=Trichechus manatus latirostris TaxID=127582 RepID=A0A2Y9E3Q4_TRIMA|nr:coiled-coil domain-containing protein 190 [Trichechus manatus latirostris]